MQAQFVPSTRDTYFLLGMCSTIFGLMVLGFTVVSWVVGGTAFKDSIYGNAALIISVIAIIAGSAVGRVFAGKISANQ